MPAPDLSRIPVFYHNYVRQVAGDHLPDAFSAGTKTIISFLEQVPEEKRTYRYAEGKWTIKDILQHITDSERVFAYRALCFARLDPAPLPGFDENIFAAHAGAGRRAWNDLLDEFKTVRRSSEMLFASFDEKQLDAEGIANGNSIYVLGIGYIMVGHPLHHMNIIRERYLAPAAPAH